MTPVGMCSQMGRSQSAANPNRASQVLTWQMDPPGGFPKLASFRNTCLLAYDNLRQQSGCRNCSVPAGSAVVQRSRKPLPGPHTPRIFDAPIFGRRSTRIRRRVVRSPPDRSYVNPTETPVPHWHLHVPIGRRRRGSSVGPSEPRIWVNPVMWQLEGSPALIRAPQPRRIAPTARSGTQEP